MNPSMIYLVALEKNYNVFKEISPGSGVGHKRDIPLEGEEKDLTEKKKIAC